MPRRRHGCAAAAAVIASLACIPAQADAARVPRATSSQWALKAVGTPAVWPRTQGAGITVAVLDTGVDLGHPDLRPNLWTNPGEIPGNGLDDDHNGYVDDANGWDFVGGDAVPADENGHGTHVAGIVAGVCKPVCGVAPKARLMVVRVLDAQANGNTQTVAAGVRYAVNNGAKVINLSLAGSTPDPDLQAAIDYASAKGVMVVAAAGNNGGDVDDTPVYPAAGSSPNLLSVAATDIEGGLDSLSNYGPRTVTLAAPGAGIVSTAIGGGTEYRSGTSMAAAVVSGSLADLRAAKRGATVAALRGALTGTARGGVPVTSGQIRLDKAVDRLAGEYKRRQHRKHAKKSSTAKRKAHPARVQRRPANKKR